MKQIPVLIVDDNDEDRYLLKRELKDTDLEIFVHEKTNGEEALSFFENYDENRSQFPELFPPAVVFLDINMPKVDGFGFLAEYEKLRKNANLSSCVVIMFSSSERPQDKQTALSYEFVHGYLVKGDFSVEQLGNKIKEICQLT